MKKDKLKEKLIEKGVSKDWIEKNFVHITDEENTGVKIQMWMNKSVLPKK